MGGLSGPQPESPIVAELEHIESTRFSCNSYRGLPDAPAFEIVAGDLPVVVSAPHAVTHEREGRVKPSGDYAGAMALVLALWTGCHAIVASRFDGCDPNWDPIEGSAYKQALVAHVLKAGVRFCLDLHGMVSASPSIVALGTADGTTVASRPEVGAIAERILRARLEPLVERHHKPIVVDGALAARNPNTVSSTIARECGIPCVQVEVATPLRVPGKAGSGIPAGERPFKPETLGEEQAARSHPDPEAVFLTMQALAEAIRACA